MKHDIVLLIAGLVRFSIFLVGVWFVATHARRVVLTLGLLGLSCTALVFTFSNAHYEVPQGVIDAATFMATTNAALLVGGLVKW